MRGHAEQMRRGIRWACALGAGGLFVYAGLMKVGDPATFLTEIRGFRLLPYPVAWVAALALPWFEIIIGASLPVRQTARLARRCGVGLLVLFLLAVALAWGRGLDVRCGCFGAADVDAPPAYGFWLIRNTLLLLAVWASRPLVGRV